MEMFMFRPALYDRLYNCKNVTVGDVPLETRQHIPEGIVTIVLCAIYYILYLPCMISLYKRMKNNACYQLLFYISIVDCCILWILGFLHGWFAVTGVVFCSYPRFNYVIGSVLSGFWIAESTADVALVINRCIGILSPKLEMAMFGGRRIYLWIGASMAYGTWWFFSIKPVLFTGIYFTWFFNPYVGYIADPTGVYNSFIHIVWDMSVAIGIPLLYILFTIAFMVQTRAFGATNDVSHKQKMMMIQVFITSMLNFVACTIYVSMNYYIPDTFILHFAQFCWMHIHGFPPVVFLCLNKTIRTDTVRMTNYALSKCCRMDRQFLFMASSKVDISAQDSNAKNESFQAIPIGQ